MIFFGFFQFRINFFHCKTKNSILRGFFTSSKKKLKIRKLIFFVFSDYLVQQKSIKWQNLLKNFLSYYGTNMEVRSGRRRQLVVIVLEHYAIDTRNANENKQDLIQKDDLGFANARTKNLNTDGMIFFPKYVTTANRKTWFFNRRVNVLAEIEDYSELLKNYTNLLGQATKMINLDVFLKKVRC